MPLSSSSFEYVRQLVKTKAGIIIEPGKEYLVENRLHPLAKGEGIDVEELVATLRKSVTNGMHRKVIDAMTTNETSFFRDVHPFDALRQLILPELIAKRAAEKTLRVWCGAASTGQEPYTIAMILKEMPALVGWRLELVATDLSLDVLAKAREGRYTQLEVNRGLPATFLVKYFEKAAMDWRVKAELRSMIRYTELNLTERFPPLPACDIVFLRNVLIYFDIETKRRILDEVRKVLRPDGFLFLGGAETTLNIHDGYERQAVERASVYRQKRG